VSAAWVEADWPAPGGVRALCTFRTGGASAAPYHSLNLGCHVGDAPAAVAENRRRLRVAAGLPAEPFWLEQVHGADVADLDAAPDPGDAGRPGGARRVGPADAAFTRGLGRVCAILTADCLPLLLAAESGDLVAAAHAGWRGLAGGVIEATMAAVTAAGAVPPERFLAWLGPAIGPRHFEVGAEVREALLAGDPGAEAAFAPNARGRFMADLGTLARRRLEARGVDRIYGGGECTFEAGDRYFSYRRDGVTGRQAALIWLEAR
jgi:purine-nucleoside/S-methyl-5'-thioadenosine phosphorylase / adenosine deaminase